MKMDAKTLFQTEAVYSIDDFGASKMVVQEEERAQQKKSMIRN